MMPAPGDLIVFNPERRDAYITTETLYDAPTYYTANDRVGFIKEDNISMCIATYVEKFSHHDVGWAYVWTNDGQFGWVIIVTKDNENMFEVVS